MNFTARTGDPQLYSEAHDAIHEAALLHAAGFAEAAIDLLEADLARSPAQSRQAWLVLFDLYHAAGKRSDFERRLPAYRAAFPDCVVPAFGPPPAIASPGTLTLSGVLDRGTPWVSEIQQHAAGRRTFALDIGQVERIVFGYLGEFAALLRAFQLQGHRIILANLSELQVALLETVDMGREVMLMRRKAAENDSGAYVALAA